MSDASVTKHFRSDVAPAFLARGFRQNGAKRYSRVVGDVFQGVFLHVETRIRREFMIEYCALLLCVPHTHYTLEHGGRFPVGSRGSWYRADSPEQLQQSIAVVNAEVPALLNWFQASETLEGFLRAFSATSFVSNGHTAMTLACGSAALGDLRSGRQHAERALSEYQGILASFRQQYPNAGHWAPVYIERARALIAAIDSSTTDALLADWRAMTTDALNIRA